MRGFRGVMEEKYLTGIDVDIGFPAVKQCAKRT